MIHYRLLLNIIYLTVDFFNCNNKLMNYSLITIQDGYIINFLINNLKITIHINDNYHLIEIKDIKIQDIQLSKIINRINYIDKIYENCNFSNFPSYLPKTNNLPQISTLNKVKLNEYYKIVDESPITLVKNINHILDIHKKYNNILIYKILLQKIIDKYTNQSMDYLFNYLIT